ncbi:MAG: response regulator [Chloroflexi bacterium]|nr:MAG: response regulator [Chloroflexota bacterium]
MREAGSRTPRNGAPSGEDSRAHDAELAETRDPEATTPAPESRIAPARILVVDDEPGVRRFVTDALRSSGYEVVGASTGREALAAIYGETRTPTLLLTDIEMPGMSGVELAARIRADRPGIRVILMTGREASAARARERAGLVEGVLLKPFGLAELLHAVLDALAESPGDPAA